MDRVYKELSSNPNKMFSFLISAPDIFKAFLLNTSYYEENSAVFDTDFQSFSYGIQVVHTLHTPIEQRLDTLVTLFTNPEGEGSKILEQYKECDNEDITFLYGEYNNPRLTAYSWFMDDYYAESSSSYETSQIIRQLLSKFKTMESEDFFRIMLPGLDMTDRFCCGFILPFLYRKSVGIEKLTADYVVNEFAGLLKEDAVRHCLDSLLNNEYIDENYRIYYKRAASLVLFFRDSALTKISNLDQW